MAFSRSSRSLRPYSYFCFDVDPARLVSDGEATARWIVSDLFGYDVGLDCVCDEPGQGSDWECAHARAG